MEELTAEDIARLTGAPGRTVRYRLGVLRRRGVAVRRVSRPCGGVELRVALRAWCLATGFPEEDARAALETSSQAA